MGRAGSQVAENQKLRPPGLPPAGCFQLAFLLLCDNVFAGSVEAPNHRAAHAEIARGQTRDTRTNKLVLKSRSRPQEAELRINPQPSPDAESDTAPKAEAEAEADVSMSTA